MYLYVPSRLKAKSSPASAMKGNTSFSSDIRRNWRGGEGRGSGRGRGGEGREGEGRGGRGGEGRGGEGRDTTLKSYSHCCHSTYMYMYMYLHLHIRH